MSWKLTVGANKAYYSYNSERHCIDARMLARGKLFRVSGNNLGEVKRTLLVLASAAGLDVFTLMPARSE